MTVTLVAPGVYEARDPSRCRLHWLGSATEAWLWLILAD